MSIPPEPGQRAKRPVLEPTYVVRRRRTESLAELMRELERDKRKAAQEEDYETQELPSVTEGMAATEGMADTEGKDSGPGLRRAAIVVAVAGASLIGFGAALLVTGAGGEKGVEAAAPSPKPPAGSTPAHEFDPDGVGTLREGDSGPEVTELQRRLLMVPNVYENGSTSGRYDATLTAAVARFQLWYGIRGDETGVYGDDTRRDLEDRTAN